MITTDEKDLTPETLTGDARSTLAGEGVLRAAIGDTEAEGTTVEEGIGEMTAETGGTDAENIGDEDTAAAIPHRHQTLPFRDIETAAKRAIRATKSTRTSKKAETQQLNVLSGTDING